MTAKHRDSYEISNIDLLLYALYQLGGSGKYVDVEDVFIEMWNLAPSRFSWRKHKYPNFKTTSQSLAHLVERGLGYLVLGEGNSRQLSAEGVKWVEERLPYLRQVSTDPPKAKSDRRPSQRVAVLAERSEIVQRFIADERTDLDRGEIALLLRCAPDAPRKVWRERLETLRSAATDADRIRLVEFLEYLEQKKGEWFDLGGTR